MHAQTSAEMAGGGGDRPSASPACRGSGPGGASADRWKPGHAPSTEEFLCRFGDAIDDRVAEILDERDTLHPQPRPCPGFAATALLLAVAATVVLRHAALAVCAVWLSTAAVCLATRTARPRRP